MAKILSYALLSVIRRYKRNMLTIIAMLIGTTTIIGLVGISESSALHRIKHLDAYSAQVIGVRLQIATWDIPEETLQERIAQIPEINGAGTLTIDTHNTSYTVKNLSGTITENPPFAVVSAEGLRAREAYLTEGTFAEPAPGREDQAVVYVGAALAKNIGVSAEPGRNHMMVNGSEVTVAGIVRDGPKNSALSTALIVPTRSTYFEKAHQQMRALEVHVNPGSADVVAAQLRTVLDPQRRPEDTNLDIPPSPVALRESYTRDSRTLTTIILAVMIASTSFGIVMTMQISVWERRREIGINRALGMSRADIAGEFLAESAVLGALGAVGGFIAGILLCFGVCVANGWELSLPPIILGIPVLGALVGMCAGCLPAFAATKVEPLELLA
ncbi:MAG: ABC transporter permease [Rothia sp. (in: high G+C Gram-positive bacteria)]|uniref:ABC transporter permease n=1 Tax=Rothia sp. (in: high G+C Gram-positive bacteria) TaxID=1885016 RepID=UPI0026E04418|nr:ABC transporter permease [Rothia sp. (in: high G+C Gram-positive bacteria)]MDO5749753.1 ABC transporter permease [Rothia sp. (in: high G+C Gram-positive bacteria)]